MLVTLPRQANAILPAVDSLSALEAIFGDLKIHYVLAPDEKESVWELGTRELISLNKEDLGWSGLPKKRFTQILRNYGFDVALDMDLSRNFINAYLGLLSGAKVRIGVQGKWGPPFYNLELIIPPHRSNLGERYDSLIRILRNLRTEKILEA